DAKLWRTTGYRPAGGAAPRTARDGIFFFSSRRRHTRSLRDWSSDVCSSDLAPVERAHGDPAGTVGSKWDPSLEAGLRHVADRARSEERRVGKECRSRWGAYH